MTTQIPRMRFARSLRASCQGVQAWCYRHLASKFSTSGKPLPSTTSIALPQCLTLKPGASIELAARRRSVECQANMQSAAAANTSDEVTVVFHVPQYVTAPGQELKVVGAAPALGAWDIHHAPSMTWQEGHTWLLHLRLPVGQHDFKLAVVRGANVAWESGSNRTVLIKHGEKLLGPEAKVAISCDYNVTVATKMDTRYDKAYLQARLNKAQKMVVSLTQRKLALQKQLVSLLHQAQESDRTTKELVVEATPSDHGAVAQLPLAHSGKPNSSLWGLSNPALESNHRNSGLQDPSTRDFAHSQDASKVDMEQLDTAVMQRALSSSLEQLTTGSAPYQYAGSATEETGVSQDVSAMAQDMPCAAKPAAVPLQIKPFPSVAQPDQMLLDSRSAGPSGNVFKSINIHRGLVEPVNPGWYASSLTASMHDEVLYGLWSANRPELGAAQSVHEASSCNVRSHDVFLEEPSVVGNISLEQPSAKMDATTVADMVARESMLPIDLPSAANIEAQAHIKQTIAVGTCPVTPVSVSTVSIMTAQKSSPNPAEVVEPEDQAIWTDVMGLLVHHNFSHMLRLSSSVGRPQLLLLQLSVAITAAALGRGNPSTSAPAPVAQNTPHGFMRSLRKAWAPLSALTRRIFPATTAAVVGVMVVGWYARVASAGVN